MSRIDGQRNQSHDLAGDVIRRALSSGQLIDEGKACERLERVTQALIINSREAQEHGDDVMAAGVASSVRGAIAVAQC